MNIFRTIILVLKDLEGIFAVLLFFFSPPPLYFLKQSMRDLGILLFTSEKFVKIKSNSSSGI